MRADKIDKIEIDSIGRLCITPHMEEFFQIWTLATGVQWDDKGRFLFSPEPREWTYLDWYKHIISVIKECNCVLTLTDDTEWINVPSTLKTEICMFQK